MKKILLILVMLLTAVTVWAGEYTFNSQTGTLTLVSGEFNSSNKWGNDVSPTAVKKVVATNQVSFTGDCSELFSGFSNCTSMDLNSVNTYDTQSSGGPAHRMNRMFKDCSKLTSLDLSNWNTSNFYNTDGMFQNCSNLTSLNISGWNPSFLNSSSNMFEGCSKLTSLDVSDLNVSNVIFMKSMFKGCSELTSLDLSSWNVHNVVFMDSLFYGCSKLTTLNVSGWQRGDNAHMSNMFAYCTNLTSLDLSSWSVEGSSINMSNMFAYCTNLTSLDLSGWLVGGSSNVSNMFAHCANLTSLNLSNWKFYGYDSNMNNMFLSCSSLTSVSLMGWYVNSGSVLNDMFSGCSNLTTIYASTSWNAGSLSASATSSMFESCTKLVGGCGTTYDSNHIGKEYARIDQGASTPGYFTGELRLYLSNNVTASSTSPIITYDGNTYYQGGSTITLTYNGTVPEGKIVLFTISSNGPMSYIHGNTFQMPFYDTSISYLFVDAPTEVTVGDITFNMIKVEGNNDISTFYIGECEVTEALWQAVMGSNPSSNPGNLQDNLPVENISWNDCQEFLAKLRQMTNLNFRLPTSAEWLFAASGGRYSSGYTYSGSNTVGDVAWYNGNCSHKMTVGTKDSNELGIHDMSGNVYEIIQEATGVYGGGWHAPAGRCQVNYYWPANEAFTDNDTGLRLAITNFFEIPESVTVGDITFNMVKVDGNDNISTFYIGECEVTEALWQEVMGSNPSSFQGNLEDNLPVENITWNDCQEFLAKLKEMTNLDFRLPTSAEWLFAAKGGNDTHGYYYSGSNYLAEVAWFKNNCSQKMTVGTKAPNELGIYDMSGNVYEIIQEATGVYGGGWHAQASACEVTYFWPADETLADDDTGFRLALTDFGSTSVLGDVNGDGAVTTADVTCIYNYLLNGDETFIDTCDVDSDGFITTVDITVIYNILLGN